MTLSVSVLASYIALMAPSSSISATWLVRYTGIPLAVRMAVDRLWATYRQMSDPEPGIFQDDDAAAQQRPLHRRKVVQQDKGLLLGTPIAGLPEQNDGVLRLAAQGEQSREIRVSRNQDPILAPGPFENFLVCRRGKSVVADMHGIVTGLSQARRDNRR